MLEPGDNAVEVMTRLDGRKESARLRAYVLQPPKLRPLEAPATGKTSVVSFPIRVTAAAR